MEISFVNNKLTIGNIEVILSETNFILLRSVLLNNSKIPIQYPELLILKLVAEYSKIPINVFLKKSRKKPYVFCRNLASSLLRIHTTYSTTEIANILLKSHSTVSNSSKTYTNNKNFKEFQDYMNNFYSKFGKDLFNAKFITKNGDNLICEFDLQKLRDEVFSLPNSDFKDIDSYEKYCDSLTLSDCLHILIDKYNYYYV